MNAALMLAIIDWLDGRRDEAAYAQPIHANYGVKVCLKTRMRAMAAGSSRSSR